MEIDRFTDPTTKSFKVFDEAWNKETIVLYDLHHYNYRILGQDGQLHLIEPCWAEYYMVLQLEREGKI